LLGEPAHGQAAEPVPVGEADRAGHDLLPAQAGPRPAAAALHSPQQLDGAPRVAAAAVRAAAVRAAAVRAAAVRAAAVLGGHLLVRSCTQSSIHCIVIKLHTLYRVEVRSWFPPPSPAKVCENAMARRRRSTAWTWQ